MEGLQGHSVQILAVAVAVIAVGVGAAYLYSSKKRKGMTLCGPPFLSLYLSLRVKIFVHLCICGSACIVCVWDPVRQISCMNDWNSWDDRGFAGSVVPLLFCLFYYCFSSHFFRIVNSEEFNRSLLSLSLLPLYVCKCLHICLSLSLSMYLYIYLYL